MKNQLIFLVIICLILLSLLKLYFTQNEITWVNFRFTFEEKKLTLPKRTPISEHWIVITTISNPREEIKEMAGYQDWTVVVVADKETPKNWSVPNCHFLSVEDQKLLGYEIVSLIPFNSYTRKMIGYLYAIEYGAKFIYDTDDDIMPIRRKLDAFEYSNYSSALVYKNQGNSTYFNVYAHFGRPDIWPRGFPLEAINEEVQEANFHLFSEIPTPTIQQALINQDADVDAVYRMIYSRNKITGLKVEFDNVAPPVVIDDQTYVPFNSKNTLFNYGAFWALMLPTAITLNATDIWRGYIAQRLLRICSQSLAFYGPNAQRNRNLHIHHFSYIDEMMSLSQSSRLVNVLQNWTCESENFVHCFLSLSKRMVKENLLLDKDYQLTTVWLKDLQKVGYTFPNVQSQQFDIDNVSNAGFVSNVEKNIQPLQNQMYSLKTLNQLCQAHVHNELSFRGFSDLIFNHSKNVVLVIAFNHPHFGTIPLLQTLYNPWFANVVFCGTFPGEFKHKTFPQIPLLFQKKYSYVNISSSGMGEGYFGYVCLTKVAEMGIKDVDGFLFISDDVLLNFWNPFDLSKVHLNVDSCIIDGGWWVGKFGENAVKKVEAELNRASTVRSVLKSEFNKLAMLNVKCGSDIFYVPRDKISDYIVLSRLFLKHRVFLEIAVPKLLAVLGWKDTYVKIFSRIQAAEDLKGYYLWDGQRANPLNFFNKSSIFLHPFKLSQLDQPFFRNGYCNSYITSLFYALSKRN